MPARKKTKRAKTVRKRGHAELGVDKHDDLSDLEVLRAKMGEKYCQIEVSKHYTEYMENVMSVSLPEKRRYYGWGFYVTRSSVRNKHAGKGLFSIFTLQPGTNIGMFPGKRIKIKNDDEYDEYLDTFENTVRIQKERYLFKGDGFILDPLKRNGQIPNKDLIYPIFINEPPPGRRANCYFVNLVDSKDVAIVTCDVIRAGDELFCMYNSHESGYEQYPVGEDCVCHDGQEDRYEIYSRLEHDVWEIAQYEQIRGTELPLVWRNSKYEYQFDPWTNNPVRASKYESKLQSSLTYEGVELKTREIKRMSKRPKGLRAGRHIVFLTYRNNTVKHPDMYVQCPDDTVLSKQNNKRLIYNNGNVHGHKRKQASNDWTMARLLSHIGVDTKTRDYGFRAYTVRDNKTGASVVEEHIVPTPSVNIRDYQIRDYDVSSERIHVKKNCTWKLNPKLIHEKAIIDRGYTTFGDNLYGKFVLILDPRISTKQVNSQKTSLHFVRINHGARHETGFYSLAYLAKNSPNMLLAKVYSELSNILDKSFVENV